MCNHMHLRHGLLVLDLSCTQQSQHVLGPLCHGVLHAVVMPQLLHTQLRPTQVRLTWETMTVLVIKHVNTHSAQQHAQMIYSMLTIQICEMLGVQQQMQTQRHGTMFVEMSFH